MLTRAVAVALLLAAPAAYASERIAVLEFTGSGVRPELLRSITDGARAAALGPASRAGFDVMSRESTALILEQMGGQCLEGQCEIEVARTVGAALVVTGEVRTLDGAFLVDLKLHGTDKGALLAAERVRATDTLQVLDLTGAASERLVKGGLERFTGRRLAAAREVADAEPRFRRWFLEVRGGLAPAHSVVPADAGGGPGFFPDVHFGLRLSEAWALDLGVGGGLKLGSSGHPAGSATTADVDLVWGLLSGAWAPFSGFRSLSLAAQAGVATVGAIYTNGAFSYRENATGPAGGLELRLDLPVAPMLAFGLRSGVLYVRPSTPSSRVADAAITLLPSFGPVTVWSTTVALQLRF